MKRVGGHDVLPVSRAGAGAGAVGGNNLVLGIGFPGEDSILRRWDDGESLGSAGNPGDGVGVRGVLLRDLHGDHGVGVRMGIP